MKYQFLTEGELLLLVAADDAAAYEVLYNRYWEPLFLFAYKRLRITAAAKDAVQEVFINLWRRRATLQVNASLRTYLFTAVRYEVLKSIAYATHTVAGEETMAMTVPAADDTTDTLHAKELQHVLADAVEKLPGKMKMIYVMSRQYHRSVAEIAQELHLSEQTVKNQLSRALLRLRAHLKEAAVIPALVPGIIFFLNN
ncbi:sigma-70 family RNA polymerase sigma factor [Chitinophaga sp. Mgbs1]|uniref:Sigma-70 family RNA polymerase sigma factor n=1 Tax=Chitinophaga solisilvae TaxID=1233460 RepID=A0A3S1B145_9BACT|nr:sigma-70 family RNA polymerase sigma factor [Chitinophaga solisilvae]